MLKRKVYNTCILDRRFPAFNINADKKVTQHQLKSNCQASQAVRGNKLSPLSFNCSASRDIQGVYWAECLHATNNIGLCE